MKDNHINNFPKSKSFTLVEVLTVVFLGALIIIAGYSVFLASYQSYKKNTESAELTQNARIALERISREIRQTNQIIPENPPTTSSIKFRDGHTLTPIQYIEYYKNESKDLYRSTSHCALNLTPNTWIDCTDEGAIEARDNYFIIAQNIGSLDFIPNPTNPSLITIKISVSNLNNSKTFNFETITEARNLL